MTATRSLSLLLCLGMLAAPVAAAKSVATITMIEGKASVLPAAGPDWRDAKPNMPVKVGDQVYAREQSFVELRYADGVVLRMNENTKVSIKASTDKAVKSETPLGTVWVNMQKIAKTRKTFELASPTAVAAIRGTSYLMDTKADSSTEVNVYNGTVDVGPSEGLKQSQQQGKQVTPPDGPTEVPGPYEVSLEQWRAIVAGQKIVVRKDGKFSQETFDTLGVYGWDAFVKKCQELDKKMKEQQQPK